MIEPRGLRLVPTNINKHIINIYIYIYISIYLSIYLSADRGFGRGRAAPGTTTGLELILRLGCPEALDLAKQGRRLGPPRVEPFASLTVLKPYYVPRQHAGATAFVS